MSTHFIDSIEIALKSGHGGHGSVSFRREKCVPRGGPDGGDGGDGGNVIIRSTPHERTLRKLRIKKHYSALDGEAGRARKKHGARGRDLIIEVPYGTVIKTTTGTELLRFANETKEALLLRGGKGGRGNVHFKSSTRQAPRYAQPGKEGSQLHIRIELELIADISFVGAPNVGKSSLLRALTNADPRVANYPFTTLIPNLGTLRNNYQELILADIPGLLKGAALGRGLGASFLRHIRRSRIICYVLDMSRELPEKKSKDCTGSDEHSKRQALLEEYAMLQQELKLYDESFAHKTYMVLCNKVDAAPENALDILVQLDDILQTQPIAPVSKVLSVSALCNMGIEKLKTLLFTLEEDLLKQYNNVERKELL